MHIFKELEIDLNQDFSVILVTGIANPTPLKKYLSRKNCSFKHLEFKDHHAFGKKDIEKILRKFKMDKSLKKLILTTEKDMYRLIPFKTDLNKIPIYFIPVEMRFKKEKEFDKKIVDYVRKANKRNC